MSTHNTEVHRCNDCNEVVIVVPAGFAKTEEELLAAAKEHLETCPAVLERTMLHD